MAAKRRAQEEIKISWEKNTQLGKEMRRDRITALFREEERQHEAELEALGLAFKAERI